MALVAQSLSHIPTATVTNLLVSAAPYLRRTAVIAPRLLSRGFSTSTRRARYPLYRNKATRLVSKPSPYHTIIRHNSTIPPTTPPPAGPGFQPGKWISAAAGSILLAGGLYIGYSMWGKREDEAKSEIYKFGYGLGQFKEQVKETISRGKERVIEAKDKTVEAVTKGKDKTVEAVIKGKDRTIEVAQKGKEKTIEMAQKGKEAAQRGKEKASEWMKKKKTTEPPSGEAKATPISPTEASATPTTAATATTASTTATATPITSQYPRLNATTRPNHFDISMVAL